jgi:hypothetical protein
VNALTVVRFFERLDDLVAAVERIAVAFERVAAALERVARTYEQDTWPDQDDTPAV